MRKFFCAALIMLLVFGYSTSAFAMEAMAESVPISEESTRYVALQNVVSILGISNGTAVCVGKAKTNSASHTLRAILQLKRYESGTWRTVATWYDTKPRIPGINMTRYKYGLASGYSYKTTLTVSVYNGSTFIESVSRDSSVVRY